MINDYSYLLLGESVALYKNGIYVKMFNYPMQGLFNIMSAERYIKANDPMANLRPMTEEEIKEVYKND